MILYTDTVTPRLKYIVNFIGNTLFNDSIQITTNATQFNKAIGAKINYSTTTFSTACLHIVPHSLLFETSIQPQIIYCQLQGRTTVFFANVKSDLGFDVFAASFYLLTRYEEYLPHTKDHYGRYAHTNALAYKENFLHQPLINYWLEALKKIVQEKFPQQLFKPPIFNFTPTYDIDIAYAYQHTSWKRTLGGIGQSLLHGHWQQLQERFLVLLKKKQDPFDVYHWLDELHDQHQLQPIYFFLVAQQQKGYDKNNSPSSRALQLLIKRCASQYRIALHPSWKSSACATEKIIREEKILLETISNTSIQASRQHYIQCALPYTYRRLLLCGITADYSMGYATSNGFRASVAWPFYWFDVERNESTTLLVFPFCFMDTNAFYQQQLSAQAAYRQLQQYYNTIKEVNGWMITIHHNHLLGTLPEFVQWKEAYKLFLTEKANR
jgi:hypothetical protein